MIDDQYIKSPAKIQVWFSFARYSEKTSVSAKFIKLCMETPCLFVPVKGAPTWWPESN